MIKGSYRVICHECGGKSSSAQAKLMRDGRWICCGPLDERIATSPPLVGVRIPNIINIPPSTENYGNAPRLTWATWYLTWDSSNTAWDEA